MAANEAGATRRQMDAGELGYAADSLEKAQIQLLRAVESFTAANRRGWAQHASILYAKAVALETSARRARPCTGADDRCTKEAGHLGAHVV